MTTLDEFARAHELPTLVKLDVEGWETDALLGASRLIARGTRFLIELHGRIQSESVVRVLRDQQYEFTGVDGSIAREPEKLHHLIASRRR